MNDCVSRLRPLQIRRVIFHPDLQAQDSRLRERYKITAVTWAVTTGVPKRYTSSMEAQ